MKLEWELVKKYNNIKYKLRYEDSYIKFFYYKKIKKIKILLSHIDYNNYKARCCIICEKKLLVLNTNTKVDFYRTEFYIAASYGFKCIDCFK